MIKRRFFKLTDTKLWVSMLFMAGVWLPVSLTRVAEASVGQALETTGMETSVGAPSDAPVSGGDTATDTGLADTSEIGAAFDRGLPLALLLVFLVGLALNLTPCIYPMLAVTVSIFGGASETRTGRVVGKAVIYVLGIATMYSALGVVAALTGGLFGGLLQSRLVLAGISLLFILLALSMFGLYELRLPPALMNTLGGAQKAGLAGVFLSGLLVGVFAAPCIGPPIIGLLALVGQRADPWFGFMVFFVLSLGLGAPYLVLGTFSGLLRKMPRSGAWMIWVKKLLGFVLIGVAFFYLSLAFRPSLVFVLIPLTLVLGGIYLGFLERSSVAGRGFVWLKRLTGSVALLAGILFFIGGRQPSLEWTPYSSERLAATRRPAAVYFSADWCIPCLELDRRTFTDTDVMRELNRLATFKADLTRYDSPESRELRERFAIRGVPTLVFLDAAGRELPNTRLVGFVNAAEMLEHLGEVHRTVRTPIPADAADRDGVMLAGPADPDPSRIELVADTAWIQPGRPFRLGIRFEIMDQWHVYWRNPGDSGIEPIIDWQLPEGFTGGALQWPHPQRFDDPPYATFGYEEDVLLARTIETPSDLAPGQTVEFSADVEWQVCKDICIVQDDVVRLQLEVRDEPPEPSTAWRDTFERAAKRLPVTDPEWNFQVSVADDGHRLWVTPPPEVAIDTVTQAGFFPKHTGFLRTGPYRWQPEHGRAFLPLTPEGPVPSNRRLHAVLVLPETAAERLELPRAIRIDTEWP